MDNLEKTRLETKDFSETQDKGRRFESSNSSRQVFVFLRQDFFGRSESESESESEMMAESLVLTSLTTVECVRAVSYIHEVILLCLFSGMI